ncbi:MAG: hypothetical protein ABI370_05265, partial [Gammaproteobacteria bacterium]
MKSRAWYKVVYDWIVEDRWIAPEERDIRGGPVPYRVLTHTMKSNKAQIKDTNTPALHIVRSHLDLPSNTDEENEEKVLVGKDEKINIGITALATGSFDLRPEQALWKSLEFLTKFKPAEWVTYIFGLLPLINKMFIFVSTWLEFGVRTLGNLFNYPLHKVRRFLVDKHSTASKIAVGFFGGIASIPFWAVSQVLTLGADVLSYARTCLDSITNLFIIPISYVTKLFGDANTYPKFLPTLWKATRSILQLVPVALLITAAVLTAGASVALQSGFSAVFNFMSTAAHPLATALSAVLHPLILGTKVVVASLMLGLASAVSKKLSSYVTRFDHYLEERKQEKEKLKKENAQKARDESQKAKQEQKKSNEESSCKSDNIEMTASTKKNKSKSKSSTSQIDDSLEIDPANNTSSEEVTYTPTRRTSESVSVVRFHG